MLLREGSRRVAGTFRTTFFGRTTSMHHGDGAAYQLPGSSQSFPSPAEIAASDPQGFGARIGPCFRAYKHNVALNKVYGFPHSVDGTSDAVGPLVSRTVGESLKSELRVLGRSPFCPTSLVGAYCMDHYARIPNSVPFLECASVRGESSQKKSCLIQTRNLATDTEKPFQQTYGKRPLDSSFNKSKINEDDKKKIKEDVEPADGKSFGARVKNLLSELENVPLPALGLGLAGAIPFVALTPGVASILPLPEILYDLHIEAQAVYGAVILSFLGGPHWGLAMCSSGESRKSDFSRISARTLQYVWSVLPSLVAGAALLLPPVSKFVVLISSLGLVCGVDALFTKMGLLPSWYMPLRILLTSIAVLSMTSSLIVIAAMNAAAAVTQ